MTMRAFVAAAALMTLVVAAPPADAAKRKKVAVTKKVKKLTDLSIGAPWSGKLEAPAKLPPGDGYFLRRPWRTYGTKTTVSLVRTAIKDTLSAFPKAHVLAIGDISQEQGGLISEHHSHQSGRDIDIGLFYTKQPKGYPAAFVTATASTLDCAKTWKLIWSFARTQDQDGGVQMMFLDSSLQSTLYKWAEENKVKESRITIVKRLLKHEPNHQNHIHVRFKCRDKDTACR
jgi:murein endopeptidase